MSLNNHRNSHGRSGGCVAFSRSSLFRAAATLGRSEGQYARRICYVSRYVNREDMMTNREQILAIMSKHIPSGSKTVDETMKLDELGLASLDVVEIIFEIEEAF